MTNSVRMVLLALALLCFILAALGVKGPAGGWTPVGLAFLTVSFWPGVE